MKNEPIHDRVQAQLDAAADVISMPTEDVSRVYELAEHRTARRQRLVVGSAVAACGVGLVGGLLVLARPAEQTFQTLETPAPIVTDQATDTTVAGVAEANGPPATVMFPGQGTGTPDTPSEPAQLTDPSFVWTVIEPAKDESITSTFSYAGDFEFPGLAMSTAPGRSNDYDNVVPVIWRTDDGISWEQTGLTSPFGTNGYFSSVSTAGQLFLAGTAPGIAATEVNPVQIAIADLSATSWTTVELPIDTHEYRNMPFVRGGTQLSTAPLDDEVLVAATPIVEPDFEAIAASNGEDLSSFRVLSFDEQGATTLADDCSTDAGAAAAAGVSVTTVAIGPDGAVLPSPNGTDSGAVEPCTTVRHAWDELGVPAESAAAIGSKATQFFLVDGDGSLTAIESPVPGTAFTSIGGDEPVLVDVRAYQVPEQTPVESFRLVNGAWAREELPDLNMFPASTTLGDRSIGFDYLSGGLRVVSGAASSPAQHVDLGALFAPNSLLDASDNGLVAAGRWVAPIRLVPDTIAEAGGVEFTKDGVTIRKESTVAQQTFNDAATGERIDSSLLAYDQQTGDVIVSNPDGTNRTRLTADEIYTSIDGAVPYDETRQEWSIATTADGMSFSVESVADLLGVENSAINYVPRMSTDGTQVVVVVSLNERWPDESRKQVVLVGTPKG